MSKPNNHNWLQRIMESADRQYNSLPEWKKSLGEERMKSKKAIIRLDDRGNPNEIVIHCDQIFIERMDKGEWFIGVYRGEKKRVAIFISGRGKSEMSISEDHFGLVNDRTGLPYK